MQSEPEHAAAAKTSKSFLSRLFRRLRHSPALRITPEIRAHLNAPAQLVVWQPDSGVNDDQIFGSLREAAAHAPDDAAARAFIVTESGHILRPTQIAKLKQFLKTTE